MRYFLEVAYNGSNYHGWQYQANAVSVQEVIEEKLSVMLSDSITIVGSGRTDTGVHAKQQFAHFEIENAPGENFLYRLNSFLPKDIAANALYPVDPGTHARFDATERSYEYVICRKKDPFQTGRAWMYYRDLNIEKMNKGAELFLEHKDFQSFSKVHTDVRTYNCDIRHIRWVLDGHLLKFHISADRFLRGMVRAIVGTLTDLGQGKISLGQLQEILDKKDRSAAGAAAPAEGLYLVRVRYPDGLLKDSE